MVALGKRDKIAPFGFKGRGLVFGIVFHRCDEVRNEVGAFLISRLHITDSGFNGFLLGNQSVVNADTPNDEERDKGQNKNQSFFPETPSRISGTDW